jgi:hypothetical protein
VAATVVAATVVAATVVAATVVAATVVAATVGKRCSLKAGLRRTCSRKWVVTL